MFDKEIEAIAKCTELVKELDEDAKVRVVKYLIERFGIGSNPNVHLNQTFHQPNPPTTKQPLLNGNSEKFAEFAEIESEDYPSVKDLLVKNYPKNETEWILCYAFYSSKFGTDVFNKEDIIAKYNENNRLSQSAKNNLINNLNSCIKKDWMKSSNSDFILKPDGISYVKEILKGKSIAKEIKFVKRKSNQKSES